MGVFKAMSDSIKRTLRSWLQIQQAAPYSITIRETMDFEMDAIRNRIWYRGDSNELEQLYTANNVEYADKYKFWASRCTPGLEMRKIHTGLPKLMVNTLTSVVLADLNDFEFPEAPQHEQLWGEIAQQNLFTDLLHTAISDVLVVGDGAFKISIDTASGAYPFIEWYPGEQVEFVRDHGRVSEVIFKTPYYNRGQIYVLNERYCRGAIINELYLGDKQVDIKSLDATARLSDWRFDPEVMLAVPLKVRASSKYKGRGGSIYDGKLDNFDAFDEVWSQWMDALRKGRAVRTVPEDMIPRDPYNGELLRSNPFDNSFVKVRGGLGEQEDSVEVTQPAIPHESYLASYITALDLCLQGIISPSTLGIDTKKLDNAEAQREKEKTTLYTRNAIVNALQDTLPHLVDACINADNILNNRAIQDVNVNIPFGEYANPSFESQVETVGAARAQGIMSIERCVEELYGDTLDEHCKQEEIARLKAEQGIQELEEPAVNLAAGEFKVNLGEAGNEGNNSKQDIPHGDSTVSGGAKNSE